MTMTDKNETEDDDNDKDETDENNADDENDAYDDDDDNHQLLDVLIQAAGDDDNDRYETEDENNADDENNANDENNADDENEADENDADENDADENDADENDADENDDDNHQLLGVLIQAGGWLLNADGPRCGRVSRWGGECNKMQQNAKYKRDTNTNTSTNTNAGGKSYKIRKYKLLQAFHTKIQRVTNTNLTHKHTDKNMSVTDMLCHLHTLPGAL